MEGLYQACARSAALWPRVEAYYSKTFRGYRMEPHTHPACELMYVFSGACRVETAALTADMRTGDYIYLDAGVSHNLLTPDAGCTMLNVEFTFTPASDFHTMGGLCAASPYFRRMIARAEPVFTGDDADGELFRALDTLVLGLSSKKARDACLGCGEMAAFLLALGQSVWENQTRMRGDRYVRGTQLYIRHHFQEPMTLPEIAAHCGISPDHLGRVFRAGTGQTVHTFLTRVRCEHAATLLLRESDTLEEIARQCGFSSRQQFDREFARLYAITPARYRRQKQRIAARELQKLPQYP